MRKKILTICLLLLTVAVGNAQNYRSGIRIGWNYRMQKFETPGGYGRVKLLSDGRLALVYDEGGVCKIRFKQPRARVFQSPINVAFPAEGQWNTNCELLELHDGTLMYAWNERWATKVKVKYSSDGGRTWFGEQTIFEQYYNSDGPFGVWEPCIIQLPDGEVQVYFANEADVPGNDQNISLMRSTSANADGSRRWQRDHVVACYTVGARDGMPVPVVLQNGRGIALAIEDDGYGGGFQPGILYTSLEDNWSSGIRYGDSPDRWIGIIGGEPRGGGAPYLIQLNTGETLLSTQTNSLADQRGAPWDDMYKFRQFVYVGNAMARNFMCYSMPFPFMDEPDQGSVWNSLCQINDSIVMAVGEVHGHPTQSGIWTNEGRIMHPLTSWSLPRGSEPDWGSAMSEVFVGSWSQANMRVGSVWNRDSLFLHFVCQDRYLCSPDAGAALWDADAVEFFYDRNLSSTGDVPAGVYKFLVNIDGNTLVSRNTGTAWQDLDASLHGMRSTVTRTTDGYTVDMAIPWSKIGRKPSSRFSGYFILHNKDVRDGRTYFYHEPLSGVDTGRSATWWEYPLSNQTTAISDVRADASQQMQVTFDALAPSSLITVSLGSDFAPQTSVSLVDTTGRTLQTVAAEGGRCTLRTPQGCGIYLLTAHTADGTRATKKLTILR